MENEQISLAQDIDASVLLRSAGTDLNSPTPEDFSPFRVVNKRSSAYSNSVVASNLPERRDANETRPSHPSLFHNDSEEYRKAVEDFFDLSIRQPATSARIRRVKSVDPYLAWLRSYPSCDIIPASSNKNTIRHLSYLSNRRHRAYIYRRSPAYEAQLNNQKDILDRYIEPISATVDQTETTMDQLLETYNGVCRAVAEIELSASTLRTNSRALTLAKTLVEEGAFSTFKVLLDSPPRLESKPIIPSGAKGQLVECDSAMTEKWKHLLKKTHKMKEELVLELQRLTNSSRSKARVGDKSVRDYVALRSSRVSKWKKNLIEWDFSDSFGWAPFGGKLRRWSAQTEREIESMRAQDLLDSTKDGEELDSDLWHTYRDQNRHWWTKYEEWDTRREERMRLAETLVWISFDLLHELGKIDGSASANDFNIATTQEEDWCLLEHYRFLIKIEIVAMGLRFDKNRFTHIYNGIFTLMEKRLRSKALKQGFDTLIKKQDHFRNTFMDFATLAIFFSSITATTLQFSFSAADQSILSTVVNLCWFASLVLSIASATNSFLGAIVHQSPEYLRPSSNFDFRILQAWFKFIPPVLLSISGLLFLIGICSLTLLSTGTFTSQGLIITHTTIGLTSANVLALVIMVLLAFTRILQAILPPLVYFALLPAQFLILSGCYLYIWVVEACMASLHAVYCLVRFLEFPPNRESWFWNSNRRYQWRRPVGYVGDLCRLREFSEDMHSAAKTSVLFARRLWKNIKNFLRREDDVGPSSKRETA